MFVYLFVFLNNIYFNQINNFATFFIYFNNRQLLTQANVYYKNNFLPEEMQITLISMYWVRQAHQNNCPVTNSFSTIYQFTLYPFWKSIRFAGMAILNAKRLNKLIEFYDFSNSLYYLIHWEITLYSHYYLIHLHYYAD